jgi:hypothetical protein
VEPSTVVQEGAAFVFVFYIMYLTMVILVVVGGLIGEYLMPVNDPSAGATP